MPFIWDTRKNKLHVHVCGNQVTDSFRRGGEKHVRRHFGGCAYFSIQFEGLQFPRGGGGTKFSRGGECPPPPLNETRQ